MVWLAADGQGVLSMLFMRVLLQKDPFLPRETRVAIAERHESSRDQLVELGLDECEAAELLDERMETCGCFD
jgi:hypothetical protein